MIPGAGYLLEEIMAVLAAYGWRAPFGQEAQQEVGSDAGVEPTCLEGRAIGARHGFTGGKEAVSCRPWDSPGKNTEVGCHFLLFE